MALVDTTWYVNSVGYAAVTARPQNTAVAAGVIRRQFTAPAVNSERCFVCIVAGTTANVTDATWVITRGAKTTDGTVTWQECTGSAAMNGDLTNTPDWTAQKAGSSPSLGSIIKRNNGVSYQICSTAGTMGVSEPAFSNTAGVTTNDGTSVWTSLGPVGNFTGGGAPHARINGAGATGWMVGGNAIYVGDNHAESQATLLLLSTAGGTSPAVSRILCHNHSGSYPPSASDLTTGATISTTGAVNMQLSPSSGYTYYYGLTFKSAVGQTTNNSLTLGFGNAFMMFDACSFEIATTFNTASLLLGTSAYGAVVFNNTTVKFAAVGQTILSVVAGRLYWQNTGQVLAAGSSVPTALLTMSAGFSLVLEGLDLSQIAGTVVNITNAFVNALIKDCKLHASGTPISNIASSGSQGQVIRSDSGATAHKSARYNLEGTETTEVTITRVSGAADPAGQAQSRKIVTPVNVAWPKPFRAEPFAVWNPTTGANVTVTVYGTINAGAVPNNDDIWLELLYLGDASFPLGKLLSTGKANILSANAAVASDGSSWNGGGSGVGWSPFKLVGTLSSPQPGLAGFLEARVCVGKASATYYIDPQVALS